VLCLCSVVQCLCLAPTYELALQIGDVTKQMSKFMRDVHIIFAVRGAEGLLFITLAIFPKRWEFFDQILRPCYMFLSMLDYKFLFNYLQL